MDLQLAGKSALVTGGSRGIGRAVALRLAGEGCSVAICARGRKDLNRTVGELRDYGARAYGVLADVGQDGEVERFVAEAAATFGRVDLLVANAGPHLGSRLVKSTPDDWREAFEVHVIHAARAIRACVPHMKETGGGAVVIIASISGWKPAPRPQYGAAKAAEIYLAMELGRELAPDGIRVNAVSPGSILFPGGGWDSLRERDPEGFAGFIEREFPFGRLGTPEEVADVVTFLLSERASWISGTQICVDGAQGRPTASSW
ncbi:MAG: SDR family oxidoreductase [Pseudonocardiales bacterium]|nr:SDR family oxidoreductase [Pseudonocardiales bacterium]